MKGTKRRAHKQQKPRRRTNESKKGPPEGRKGFPTVEQQLEKMTKELALTDEQKPKVKEVIEENRKKMQELYASAQGGGDRAAMREKRQTISDDQDKKLKV